MIRLRADISRYKLAIAAAVLVVASWEARATEPLKSNDFASVNARLASLEARVTTLEARLDGASFTSAPAALPVVARPITALPSVTVAVGHTHTCRNGHTWDHTMDGGSHRCPFCGDVQYAVSGRSYVTTPTIQKTSQSWGQETYSISTGSFSGCSGAGCSTSGSYQRRGIFGGFFRR